MVGTVKQPMTDYEQQRLENIKKNQSILSSLAIPAKISFRSEIVKDRLNSDSSSTPSRKRKNSSASSKFYIPPKRHATRASVKSGQVDLSLALVEGEDPLLLKPVEPFVKNELERDRHLDRSLVAHNFSSRNGDRDLSYSSLFTNLKTTGSSDLVDLYDQSSKEPKDDQLRSMLDGLKLRSACKVCPSRVYSIAFHSDRSKSLIFIGEKSGGVSVWDPLARSTEEEEGSDTKDILPQKEKVFSDEDEEEILEGKSYYIQAHPSSVSAIQTHPSNPHLIFTSSYDRSVRQLNFETQSSSEILDGDQLGSDGDQNLFSAFEFINEGREIWCSDTNGGLSHYDLRLPKTSARRWNVSYKKIGCVNIRLPHSDHKLAVTAGLNREMRIWDLSRLMGLSTDAEVEEIERVASLSTYTHRLACSSAYFNHTGRKIVSTSYDDLIRVWDLNSETVESWEDSKPTKELSELDDTIDPAYYAVHDNKTGRWVTPMKARWCPNPLFPTHFTVGNMKQKLDVYSDKARLIKQLADPSVLKSVPAVTNQHPTSSNLQIVGGVAGGKAYFWM
ncbi:WD40-repeat-containing domain protein [Phakopsora pachyrhizi]|uniref:DNA damage-binding protein CMR1 n=1 Tax=Phakopsora pachyrhizi TaxID=170000 RepID=A0AAV0B950_PHAPC|nr:WD40-repeat-containing domain protein [Phakopsora pachyrhizi]